MKVLSDQAAAAQGGDLKRAEAMLMVQAHTLDLSRFSDQAVLEEWLLRQEESMRSGRFSDEQMVAILREAARSSVAEGAKKHKVSERTL